jgi:hypothetical protein
MNRKPPPFGRKPRPRVQQTRAVKSLPGNPPSSASERTWKVKVVGAVSRPQGSARVAVPHGDYIMTETRATTYLLSRPAGPKFALTAAEIDGYLKATTLRIVEGQWP